ncbi:MAG: hypothetical protein JST89_09200 [Cyanobacteria bacterium SZAS-4]|nr:hypothetical protein [Cyanobacteria bacterium SZAS-4]
MSNSHTDKSSKANSADLLDAFKAPFAEREVRDEAQQNGLVLFSFGRNGGFAKPGDQSKKDFSVA